MKNQNLYIVLMLALLVNTSNPAKAFTDDPMNVKTDSSVTISVEDKTSEEEKKEEEKAEQAEEVSPEEAAKQCLANRQSLANAVTKYNTEKSVMMSQLNIDELVKEGYLSKAPTMPTPSCRYSASGDLTNNGHIICACHGGEESAQQPKEEKKVITHTVKQGESLWRIAQQYLGDGNRYRELIEANKDTYPSLEKNPNLIYKGWQIKVILDEANPTETPTENADATVTDNNGDNGNNPSVTDRSKDAEEVAENIQKIRNKGHKLNR